MLRPSTSAATARQRADEETEAEPVRVRNPGPRVRTRRELGPPPRGSDGDGSGCRCARPGRTPNRAPEEAAAAAEGDDHDAIARGTQGIGGLALPPTHYQQERFGGGLGGREWKSGVALGDGSLAPRPPPAFRFVMGSGSRQQVNCAVGKSQNQTEISPSTKTKADDDGNSSARLNAPFLSIHNYSAIRFKKLLFGSSLQTCTCTYCYCSGSNSQFRSAFQICKLSLLLPIQPSIEIRICCFSALSLLLCFPPSTLFVVLFLAHTVVSRSTIYVHYRFVVFGRDNPRVALCTCSENLKSMSESLVDS